jgi:hypothetical protein
MSLWDTFKSAVAGKDLRAGITVTLPTFNTNPTPGAVPAVPMDVIPSLDYQPMLKRRTALIEAICESYDQATPHFVKNDDGTHVMVHGKYQPVIQDGKIVTTFCNYFSCDVALKLGCRDLWDDVRKAPKMANAIYDFLVTSKDWSEVQMSAVQAFANQGYLVVASEKTGEHGHICVVRPGVEQDSHRWVKVPSVVNVGQDNFIGKGLNWAFSELPKFFFWRAGV